MWRWHWALVLMALVCFSFDADAFILGKNSVFINGGNNNQLAVYPGCDTPPSAPNSYASSKTWYFGPVDDGAITNTRGATPAEYSAAGVSQANWGDINHPLYPISAIWDQIGAPNKDYAGWGSSYGPNGSQAGTPNNLHVLAGLGFYNNTSNKIVQDYANYTALVAGDTNHYRLWPGDTVLVRGDSNGDSYGSVFFTPGGSATLQTVQNIDGSGNTKWVWIKNDPNYPAPIFKQIDTNNILGVIFQGFYPFYQQDFTSLSGQSAYYITNSGSGGPSGSNTVIYNVPLVDSTTPSATGATANITFSGTGTFTGSINGTTLIQTSGTSPQVGATITGAGVTAGTVITGITTAGFTGEISGNTLTVTGPVTGTIAVGQYLSGLGATITSGTHIIAGSGKVWTVDISQNPGPTYINAFSGVFTVNNSQTVSSETLTPSASGSVSAISFVNGGTGYKPGDVLTIAANSGDYPSTGSISGFSMTVTQPNITLAGNDIDTAVQVGSPSGDTITLGYNTSGGNKTFTFGGGANPIPYPSGSGLVDELYNSIYTFNNDSTVNPAITAFMPQAPYLTWKELTPITSIPSPTNTFTFAFDNSSWEWVSSGATGKQINIPASPTLTNVIQAAQTALAAFYPELTLTSVTSGSTGVSWTGSSGKASITSVPSSGNTFTWGYDGSSWEWVAYGTSPVGDQIELPNAAPTLPQVLLAAQSALATAYPQLVITATTNNTGASTGVSWAGANSMTLPIIPTSAPFLPTASSTFSFAGVSGGDTWTWVTGSPTGKQIQIGTSLQDTMTAEITALEAFYPNVTITQPAISNSIGITANTPGIAGILQLTSTLTFSGLNENSPPIPLLDLRNTNIITNISGGGTGIIWQINASPNNWYGQSYSENPSNGNTFSVTGSSGSTTLTWVTGTPGANQIQIGASLDASLNNAATYMTTNASTLGIQSVSAGCDGGGNNCLVQQMKDVIFDSFNISSWGPGHAINPTGMQQFPTNDYPSTQASGINVNTGVHGTPGGQWTAIDWSLIPAFSAIEIAGLRNWNNGVNVSNTAGPTWGESCVAITNSYVHHTSTVGTVQSAKTLVQNVTQNYNTGDAYDHYSSQTTIWNKVSAYNAVNSALAIHPDGIQFGEGGSYNDVSGVLFPGVTVTNNKFVGDIDTTLTSITFTGIDGLTYDLTSEQSGFNETGGTPMTGAVFSNNLIYSNHCEAFYLGDIQNSTISNNSVIYKGSDVNATEGCGMMLINNVVPGVTSQGGNTITNNVAVGIATSYSSSLVCNTNLNTMSNNLIIPPYYGSVTPAQTGQLFPASLGKGYVCNETTNTAVNSNGVGTATSETGPILQNQIALLAGGSGGNNGTITGVPLTGGIGSGAIATLTISGGAVTKVTITTPGSGYRGGDVLSAAANSGNSPSTGSLAGFSFTLYPTFNGGGIIYQQGPYANFSNGTFTAQAWGYASVNASGGVSGITITNGGDYSVAPGLTFGFGGNNTIGVLARGTPVLTGTSVTSVTMTTNGTLYTPTPVINGNYFMNYTPCDTPYNYQYEVCPIMAQSQLNGMPPGYPSSPTGPLVSTGTITGALPYNIDGNSWPNGIPDIGAY